jgi:hypothetical protein
MGAESGAVAVGSGLNEGRGSSCGSAGGIGSESPPADEGYDKDERGERPRTDQAA